MKVLIVSHNCFSTTQNMGKTLMSLFSEFKKEELMQLYFYPSVPNVDVCDSCYRITDNDALHSILKRKSCGKEVVAKKTTGVETLFEKAEEAEQYKKINRNSFFVRRLRDFAWKISAWKSNDLKKWLREGKPDVIFYALGDSAFSQNIAMWAAKFLGVPLVTYVCDEYYFYYKEIRKFNLGLTSNIKKIIRRSATVVSICDTLGEAYKNAFGTPYITVMTGSSFAPGTLEKGQKRNQISYIGNLSLNRWKSLLDISEVIDEINAENSENYSVVYYGSENDNLKGKIKYGGKLDTEGVKKVMAESLMLVHAETFDEVYRERLRYSVSTKIADSLASGTPLLAYGPSELASMQHLITNKCAVFADNKTDLKCKLLKVLFDSEYMSTIGMCAVRTARKLHDSEGNSAKLYAKLCELRMRK